MISPTKAQTALSIPMNITANKVALLEFELTSDSGEVLDTSAGRQPLAYIHGKGGILPGLEKALDGRAEGDEFSVRIPAEDAYGKYVDGMEQRVPRDQFPAEMELIIGMQLQAKGPDGQVHPVMVTEISDKEVLLDANHPLAGVPLNFEIKIKEVREASEEEMGHGHVHGPGGHKH
jgi:FKBP-type peptidyl-prolyl cis-trans isomerase SlyD